MRPSSLKWLLSAFILTLPLSAEPITWTLSDVTLSDGSSVTGSFTFDAHLSVPGTGLTNFDVAVHGGSVLPDFIYTPSDPLSQLLVYSFTPPGGVPVEVINLFRGRSPSDTAFEILYLETTTFLSNAGGVVPLDTALSSGQLSNGEVSVATEQAIGGSFVGTAATPEPTSLSLLVLGALLMVSATGPRGYGWVHRRIPSAQHIAPRP